MKYTCTTETGSVYVLDYDEGTVEKNGDFVCGLHTIKSVPSVSNRDRKLWSTIHSSPDVEFPTVGDRMYVSGGHVKDWAFTTDIASVVKS